MLKKLLAILLILFSTPFYGCGNNDFYTQKTSQLRDDILVYTCNDFTLFAYLEKTESPLTDDGLVGKVENTIIFKLKTKSPSFNCDNSSLEFNQNGKNYTKQFEFKQITSLLSCTVTVDNLPKGELDLKLIINGKIQNITLASLKNKSTKNWEKAIEKMLLEEDFANLVNAEKVELRIRLIDNNGYDYWYVGVVGTKKTTSYLLDGESLEIIAKKTN